MTLDYAESVRSKLKRASLVPLPGCGHIPMRECPAAFQSALIQALDAPPGS